MITFGPQWKTVLRRAWSVRLIALAVLLTLLDIGAVILETLGLMADRPGWSVLLRSLAAVCGAAAFVARLAAQKGVE